MNKLKYIYEFIKSLMPSSPYQKMYEDLEAKIKKRIEELEHDNETYIKRMDFHRSDVGDMRWFEHYSKLSDSTRRVLNELRQILCK